MHTDLFSDFQEVTAKQWKQKIQFDLKGADYNEKLVWNSLDGVDVRPFYHFDDTVEPAKVDTPGQWKIVEQIYVASAERANQKALKAIEKGVESLWFRVPKEDLDLDQLFRGLEQETVNIYIATEFHSLAFVERLQQFSQLRLFLQMDIIGNLARSGNWYQDLRQDHSVLNSALAHADKFTSMISIDCGLYQNAGANIPQQLAYGLAHLNEYLNHISQSKLFPETSKKDLTFQFLTATGPNYFFEIAKLRALRLLVATLAREYGFSENCHILAQPSKRNKSLYDFNVNLLRTTTESMSSVLGGADAIYNMPYDALYHKNNEFGSRIARNQLLILKHESYFEKVSNPAEGSYYIESLTRQLADAALSLFKEIEKGGGFLTQLKEGIIQKKISESAGKEQEQFNSGELVLIGTNKFPNPDDRMKEELQLFPFLKYKPRKTLLQPILEKRLSEKAEQDRLAKEG